MPLVKLVERLSRVLHGEMNLKSTDFVARIRCELDFAMYRPMYNDLLTYFSIQMPIEVIGSLNITAEQCKSPILRNNFLHFFGSQLKNIMNLKDVVIKK